MGDVQNKAGVIRIRRLRGVIIIDPPYIYILKQFLAFSSRSPKFNVVSFNLIKFKAGSTESSMHSNINIDSFV